MSTAHWSLHFEFCSAEHSTHEAGPLAAAPGVVVVPSLHGVHTAFSNSAVVLGYEPGVQFLHVPRLVSNTEPIGQDTKIQLEKLAASDSSAEEYPEPDCCARLPSMLAPPSVNSCALLQKLMTTPVCLSRVGLLLMAILVHTMAGALGLMMST